MKKNIVLFVVALMITLAIPVTSIAATHQADTDMVNHAVKLTEQQQKEISKLYKEALEKKKEIIGKYVEYGILSAEKGKKIMAKMDEHYEKLEKDGFVPHWDKVKKKRKHHHHH